MSKTPHLANVESMSSMASQPDLLPPPSYTEATGSTSGPSRSTTTSTFSVPGPGSAPVPIPTGIRTSGESPLTTHLRTLPSRLRSAQHSHSTAQSSREAILAAQCVPHIEWFIDDVVNLPKTPRVAELLLVPTEALPGVESTSGYETSTGRELARKRAERDDKGWELAGHGANERMEEEEGEVVKLVCVCVSAAYAPEQHKIHAVTPDEKGRHGPVDMDRKGHRTGNNSAGSVCGSGPARSHAGGDYTFGDWGRFETTGKTSSSSSSPSRSRSMSHFMLGPEETWNWFTTPILARRIALLLRPEPTLARKTVQAAVEAAPKTPTSPSSSKKSGFGSFFRRSSSKSDPQTPPPPLPTERVITPVRHGAMLEDDGITMTVRAEEVTFRRENEFGVWESLTGWAVVVSIKVGSL
ncbi:hypothetical protein QBC32DRAFT_344192 [Pseudoneurospora amorphoporcata]|uniref:Uncharacterized protein n=1 Tax=Pseudoneurospora amorphoporcata TaxID=241081 RepID=A0AAN6NWC5_9PEZI|nr:hypothetical protein QBC32DRAFT_344192 [Pseudoneurospora amorphoporcata]